MSIIYMFALYSLCQIIHFIQSSFAHFMCDKMLNFFKEKHF